MLLLALLVIAILIACIAIFPGWTRNRNLEKSHRYTIAIVDSIIAHPDGDPSAYFTFFVNGIGYKSSASSCCGFTYGGANIGDWILVEYYPLDPNYNVREGSYYFEPYNSLTIPPNGWDTIPPSLMNLLQGRESHGSSYWK